MKPFLLALLLLLGSSVFSARYLEDANEQMSEHRDNNEVAENERGMAEEMEDQRNGNGKEDDEQENSETREDEDEQENSETREDEDEQENSDAREEVVKIRPGQTSEKNDEERDNAEFADRRAGFEEDADDMNDSRMMDGNEGGMALDANEEKENGPDEGMFENFKRKAGEIRQENENILAKMSELEAKFDEALSSDGHDAPQGLSKKPAEVHDTSNNDQRVHKTGNDSPKDVRHTGTQLRNKDDLARQYSEMGEDANSDPDADY